MNKPEPQLIEVYAPNRGALVQPCTADAQTRPPVVLAALAWKSFEPVYFLVTLILMLYLTTRFNKKNNRKRIMARFSANKSHSVQPWWFPSPTQTHRAYWSVVLCHGTARMVDYFLHGIAAADSAEPMSHCGSLSSYCCYCCCWRR